jgi:MFS family permease
MHGLYLLWWVQEKHVPVGIVATVLAAGDLTITALEIPTGWLADRCGHRISLIVGSCAQIAGMLWAWLGNGVPGLVAAIVLIAAGDAFRSGADQALLYRSCVALQCEPDFQTIESRAHSAQLTALVAFIVAGGAIVERWGFGLGWLLETSVSAIGLLIALAMIEPPASIDETRAEHQARDATPASRSRAVALSAMLTLMLPASVLGAIGSAAAFVAQTAGNTSPMRLTMLVAGITLAEAIGAAVSAHVVPRAKVQFALAAAGIAATAAAIVVPSAFLSIVVALAFLMGMAEPLRAVGIQRAAADDVRARMASIASACDKACVTVALLCVGWLPRRR